MENLFIVGDVHGKLTMLETLLTKWNPDTHRLVFLGDFVDRGEDSYGVVNLAARLCEDYGAKAVKGNHDVLFLDWLENAEDVWFSKWVTDESILNTEEEAGNSFSIYYFSQGGAQTVNSFYNQQVAYRLLPTRQAAYIKENFAYELDFLRNLPSYLEFGPLVCVHAGVDLFCSDWKKTKEEEFYLIRERFHYPRNETGKTFVFGHTPTYYLNKDESSGIWISPCQTKIGIDGGAVFGRELHGLCFSQDGASVWSVQSNLEIKHRLVNLPI